MKHLTFPRLSRSREGGSRQHATLVWGVVCTVCSVQPGRVIRGTITVTVTDSGERRDGHTLTVSSVWASPVTSALQKLQWLMWPVTRVWPLTWRHCHVSCVMMVPGPGSDQEGGAQQKLVVAFRNKGDPFVIWQLWQVRIRGEHTFEVISPFQSYPCSVWCSCLSQYY